MIDDKIIVEFEIDMAQLQETIDKGDTLDNNDELFRILSQIASVRAQVQEAIDTVDSIEKRVKSFIDTRMKRDEGISWEAVEGKGYKITKSRTGSIYDFNATFTEKDILNLPTDLVKATYKPNNRGITEYIKTYNKLPDGVVYNPTRNDRITIKVLES